MAFEEVQMSVIDEIVACLSSEMPEPLIGRDRWFFETQYFGPYARTGSLGRHAVFFGAGSGLFPLLHAKENPDQKVLVLEKDPKYLAGLLGAAGRLGLANVEPVGEVAPILERVVTARERVGLVVFEHTCFSRETLRALEKGPGIDIVLGTFDESLANPLWLHRWSRRNSRRFHWHNESAKLPVVGAGFEGPDVSVIVPAYGIEKYLDQCLESLTGQTLEDLEILVVDDGARDRSGLIADEWANRDSRVRVIHQANAGCAAARSNGLRAARGYWVGLVDGDDWVDTPMFEALAESAARFTSDIAQCGYRHCFDSDGSWSDEIEHPGFRIHWGAGSGLIGNPMDLIVLRPTIWRRIYRRDFLQGNGIDFPVHIRRFDDLPFHFMTLALADRLSVVGACYYNYRQQRPGQDINVSDERLNVHFPIFQILKQFVRAHCSFDLEACLFNTQVASHAWALTVIDPALAKDYRLAAKYDLFGEPLVLSTSEKLGVARGLGRKRAAIARAIRRQRGTGEGEWMKVKDYHR